MQQYHGLRALSAALAALFLTAPVAAPAQLALSLTDQPPRSISGIRFRFIADSAVRGGLGLDDNRLLFGTEGGSFYAIDARDGRELWRQAAGSPVLSTPAVLGSRAYFTTWDNALHAIDVASGRELWRADLGPTLGTNDYWEYYVSSPVIVDDRLYVGSGSGRVFALDPESGRIAWSADLRARVRTTPLVVPGKVIVGTMGGHVIALDSRDGHQLWKFASEGAAHDFAFKHNDTRSIVTPPILVGQTVIAGGRDGNIYGIDLATGTGRWKETHDGGSWILGLAADPTVFYSGSGSAFIMQAADVATGKELWRSPTGSALFGGVAKAADVLVSNASLGNLFAFDTKGKELWRLRLPDMSFASPLVAPGAIYTGADDGSVIAVDTNTSPGVPHDRYVYTFTNQPEAGSFWFRPEVVAALKGQFDAAGYTAAGNADLAGLLSAPVGDKGRKIVVIGDTRLPDNVDAPLLRKFVDGGGILVLVGPNPLAFKFDESGAPVAQDEEGAAAALGLAAADIERDNGYNVSTYVPQARPYGLAGTFVANRWTPADKVSVPLALDRSGMATAWIKRFANGGLIIALPVARNRPEDLTPVINAIGLIAGSAER
jgi:eukaryotic-like serine/threonine-protein kinase